MSDETILPRAVPDRGEHERHHAEPVVQIFAEASGLDFGLQLLVGGRDQTHVHRDFSGAAKAPEGLGLEHLEELGLQLRREVADLIEEDRAVVGDLEEALLPVFRVGERTLLVAEQLGVEEGGVESRAVDLDEGCLGPGTEVMNHAGDPAFARSALSGEENGGPFALSEERDLMGEVLHAGGRAERIEAVIGRALNQEGFVYAAEPRLVGDPGGGGGQVLHVHRLGQEVLGAELHGAHRRGDVRLAREQDDGGVPLAQVLQHFQAIHPGKPEIQHDHLRPKPIEGGQACLPAQLPCDLIAQSLEIVSDTAQNVDIIVDQQNRSQASEGPRAEGSDHTAETHPPETKHSRPERHASGGGGDHDADGGGNDRRRKGSDAAGLPVELDRLDGR